VNAAEYARFRHYIHVKAGLPNLTNDHQLGGLPFSRTAKEIFSEKLKRL
jgi:hypothetical protein